MFFLYKHLKFQIQARLCLAIYYFEAHIMLSSCLTFPKYWTTSMGKPLTPLCLRSVDLVLVITIDL